MSRQVNQDGSVVVTATEEPEKALEQALTQEQKNDLAVKLKALKQALSDSEEKLKNSARQANHMSLEDIRYEVDILLCISNNLQDLLGNVPQEPRVQELAVANLLTINEKYTKILNNLPI